MPFLKPKKLADTIIASRSAKGEVKQEPKAAEGMMAKAEALISAIHDKDSERVATILSQLQDVENEQE